VSILHGQFFSFDDLVWREQDPVCPGLRPWELGAGIRLLWLTDSLRDSFTKLAAEMSRQYTTAKLRTEITLERGFTRGVQTTINESRHFMKWRLCEV
jgi:hypothetical protein